MKILHIINSLNIGGAEKLLVDMIPLFREKGYQIDILLFDGTETPFKKILKEKEVCIYQGYKVSIYSPLHIFCVIPYLKKYDVIHVHLFPSLYWVALAKFFSSKNTKLIFTEHSTHNRRIGKKIWQIFDKFIYSQYNIIVSITKAVDATIKAHLLFPSNNFKIINNCIDLSQFSKISKNNNAVESKMTIIQISSFRNSKDQATLIKSLQYLPENVNLLLVGDGENRMKCERLVREINLSNRVSFLGIRTDIPKLLETTDIVVLSSNWEGFGLAAVEGMAAGCPVIVSDVPGLSDIVRGAGLLFPVGDEKILAEKINSLISDRDFYERTAKACCERSKQYDIYVMVDKYIELYEEILNS